MNQDRKPPTRKPFVRSALSGLNTLALVLLALALLANVVSSFFPHHHL